MPSYYVECIRAFLAAARARKMHAFGAGTISKQLKNFKLKYCDIHIVGDVKIDRFLIFFHNGVPKMRVFLHYKGNK